MRLLASKESVARLGVAHREVRARGWRVAALGPGHEGGGCGRYGGGCCSQGVQSHGPSSSDGPLCCVGLRVHGCARGVTGGGWQVSIMFSDIVGFTTMAEALDPEVLIEVPDPKPGPTSTEQ